MKPRIILTHAAAFCIGGALLWLVPRNPADSKSTGAETSGPANRPSAAGGPAAFAGDGTSDPRDRRAARTLGRQPGSGAAKPAATLDAITLMGDPLERQSALLDIVSRLAPDDFAAFAKQYRDSDHFADSNGEYEIILRAWAKVDPLGALDDATDRGNRRDASTLLTAWAGTDAAAAEQWALQNHQGDGPNRYLTAVIRGVAAYDVNRASELASTMPRSRERGWAMDAVTSALFKQGTGAAMDFPNTIEDPQIRRGYVRMISDRLARKDPETAASWLTSFADGATQNQGARSVASALARQDVQQAAQWVGKLDPAARAEAARGVIVPMSNNDIQGTARWVSTLAGVPGYDRVVEEFVWSCDVRDPEQSAAWIQAVADPAQQTRLYHRMLGGWSNRDADAVKQWVANNDVPENVARRFRR